MALIYQQAQRSHIWQWPHIVIQNNGFLDNCTEMYAGQLLHNKKYESACHVV